MIFACLNFLGFNSFGVSFFIFFILFPSSAIVLTKDPECTRRVPQGQGQENPDSSPSVSVSLSLYVGKVDITTSKKRVPSKQSAEGGPNGPRCLIDKHKQLAWPSRTYRSRTKPTLQPRHRHETLFRTSLSSKHPALHVSDLLQMVKAKHALHLRCTH